MPKILNSHRILDVLEEESAFKTDPGFDELSVDEMIEMIRAYRDTQHKVLKESSFKGMVGGISNLGEANNMGDTRCVLIPLEALRSIIDNGGKGCDAIRVYYGAHEIDGHRGLYHNLILVPCKKVHVDVSPNKSKLQDQVGDEDWFYYTDAFIGQDGHGQDPPKSIAGELMQIADNDI